MRRGGLGRPLRPLGPLGPFLAEERAAGSRPFWTCDTSRAAGSCQHLPSRCPPCWQPPGAAQGAPRLPASSPFALLPSRESPCRAVSPQVPAPRISLGTLSLLCKMSQVARVPLGRLGKPNKLVWLYYMLFSNLDKMITEKSSTIKYPCPQNAIFV